MVVEYYRFYLRQETIILEGPRTTPQQAGLNNMTVEEIEFRGGDDEPRVEEGVAAPRSPPPQGGKAALVLAGGRKK